MAQQQNQKSTRRVFIGLLLLLLLLLVARWVDNTWICMLVCRVLATCHRVNNKHHRVAEYVDHALLGRNSLIVLVLLCVRIGKTKTRPNYTHTYLYIYERDKYKANGTNHIRRRELARIDLEASALFRRLWHDRHVSPFTFFDPYVCCCCCCHSVLYIHMPVWCLH